MDSTSQESRVRVAIRCRPALRSEVEDNKTQYLGVVRTAKDPSGFERVILTQNNGKPRDFIYDHAFGPEHDQDIVFEAVAQPVIDDFLGGRNGTLFAYGQTGTGKTYTMGVLEFISDEHAGIIPRTISRIFEYADEEEKAGNATVRVSLSFLQLYRDTVQDLLSPLAGDRSHSEKNNGRNSESSNDRSNDRNNDRVYEDSLSIREDPLRGFFVEGLQEFQVSSYGEAEVLVNLGLENRAMASTLMNNASSRSHTLLTLHVEVQQKLNSTLSNRSSGYEQGGKAYVHGNENGHQNGYQNGNEYGYHNGYEQYEQGREGSIVRSKLMLVDLAGSERVRRSESQGARLAEAKSINSSLSALGNVIAALAGLSYDGNGHTHGQSNGQNTHGQTNTHGQAHTQGHTHIPYRDTKLTKLLQDSLGGSASTALIATISPAAVNYGETLSTLQFASRCMSVRGIIAVKSVDIDHVWACAKLKEEVGILSDELARQQHVSVKQTEVYEATIRQLYTELIQSRRLIGCSSPKVSPKGEKVPKGEKGRDFGSDFFDFDKLEMLIDHISAVAPDAGDGDEGEDGGEGEEGWIGGEEGDEGEMEEKEEREGKEGGRDLPRNLRDKGYRGVTGEMGPPSSSGSFSGPTSRASYTNGGEIVASHRRNEEHSINGSSNGSNRWGKSKVNDGSDGDSKGDSESDVIRRMELQSMHRADPLRKEERRIEAALKIEETSRKDSLRKEAMRKEEVALQLRRKAIESIESNNNINRLEENIEGNVEDYVEDNVKKNIEHDIENIVDNMENILSNPDSGFSSDTETRLRHPLEGRYYAHHRIFEPLDDQDLGVGGSRGGDVGGKRGEGGKGVVAREGGEGREGGKGGEGSGRGVYSGNLEDMMKPSRPQSNPFSGPYSDPRSTQPHSIDTSSSSRGRNHTNNDTNNPLQGSSSEPHPGPSKGPTRIPSKEYQKDPSKDPSNVPLKDSSRSEASGIVDRIAALTSAQIDRMDPAARDQVLSIRRQLGVNRLTGGVGGGLTGGLTGGLVSGLTGGHTSGVTRGVSGGLASGLNGLTGGLGGSEKQRSRVIRPAIRPPSNRTSSTDMSSSHNSSLSSVNYGDMRDNRDGRDGRDNQRVINSPHTSPHTNPRTNPRTTPNPNPNLNPTPNRTSPHSPLRNYPPLSSRTGRRTDNTETCTYGTDSAERRRISRPAHWQHRYRDYNEGEGGFLSDYDDS